MNYFVTGGTGFIGTRVVEELVEDGHEVITVTRSAENAAHLPEEVAVVEGDITRKETMRDAMTGVDGVFHIAAWFYMGSGRDNVETARRINVEGSRNVLELMAELDIPKGVYTSTAAITGNTGDEPVTESFQYDGRLPTVYQRTKWRAHHEVAQPMIEKGLPLVIVMPGSVYGPGQKTQGTSRSSFVRYLEGDLPMLPRETAMPFDHVEDIAHAHVLGMRHGEPGEEYFITSEPRTLAEVIERAEEITGIPSPRIVLPKLIRGLGAVMSVVERFLTPPTGMEAEMLRFFGETKWILDNSKAQEDLGLEHRQFDDAFREYLEWELEQLENS
jgi:dihydroflavonol-4-reductase